MKRRSFTLLELMIVIIIIGVLAAMAMPRFAGRSEEARTKVAEVDVKTTIPMALKLYEADNGRFPTTAEGLNALLDKPSGALNWKGPYLEAAPLDPWGKSYGYACPAVKRKYDYDLWSSGPDTQTSTTDDIVNW